MTIQKEKIEAVIRQDATGTGELCNKLGNMCVIGGLLHATGRRSKRRLRTSKDGPRTYPSLQELHLLFVEYGLLDNQVDQLIAINDMCHEVEGRRMALIRRVDSFVELLPE